MREQIRSALTAIEAERSVRVLFACESGSRAWGFASQDSDYDVRFIYAHKPDWYLSVDQGRDVIEDHLPGDLDVAGWELRKALRLFRKSNPPLLEWLRSPIIYAKDDDFFERLHSVRWDPKASNGEWSFSPQRCFEHYASMARGNIRNYFDREEVPLKKYLYVVRPILACLWIEQFMSLPPVAFSELVNGTVTDATLLDDINGLVSKKGAGTELGTGSRIESIHCFVDEQMSRIAEIRELPDSRAVTHDLDQLFIHTVGFPGA